MRLKNKVAIVTGSAQGIGEATARRFAEEGAKVVVCDIQEAKAAAVTRSIIAGGGDALAVTTDVADREQVAALVEATRERYKRLDVLVNNAGVGLVKPVDEVEEADYSRVIETNLRGTYHGCNLGVPLMKESGRGGSIINIASVHGVQGARGHAIYAASKGGIIGCTRAMAADLAPAKIRVNSISPGAIYIETMRDFIARDIGEEGAEEFMRLFRDKLRNSYSLYQPLEQVGETEDIANCALFLASDEATFITGQNITVDGGMTTVMSDPESIGRMEKIRDAHGEMGKWMEQRKAELAARK